MGFSPVLWQFLIKWLTNSALFPREASTIAPYMDTLYLFLVGITIVGLLLVLALERSFRQLEISWPTWAARLPGYLIGFAGAFWTIQRTAIMMGVVQ